LVQDDLICGLYYEERPEKSGDGSNPNRDQQECDVKAGSQEKRVEGQYKKECQ